MHRSLDCVRTALAPAAVSAPAFWSGCASSAFLICCTGCGANSATAGGVCPREVRATAATSTDSARTAVPRTIAGVLGRFAAATRSPPVPAVVVDRVVIILPDAAAPGGRR
jgi:hypothetical protein